MTNVSSFPQRLQLHSIDNQSAALYTIFFPQLLFTYASDHYSSNSKNVSRVEKHLKLNLKNWFTVQQYYDLLMSHISD